MTASGSLVAVSSGPVRNLAHAADRPVRPAHVAPRQRLQPRRVSLRRASRWTRQRLAAGRAVLLAHEGEEVVSSSSEPAARRGCRGRAWRRPFGHGECQASSTPLRWASASYQTSSARAKWSRREPRVAGAADHVDLLQVAHGARDRGGARLQHRGQLGRGHPPLVAADDRRKTRLAIRCMPARVSSSAIRSTKAARGLPLGRGWPDGCGVGLTREGYSVFGTFTKF